MCLYSKNTKKMKTALKLASGMLISLSCWAAQAQGVEMVRRAYQETPALPIAPAMGKSVWKVERAVPATVTATSTSTKWQMKTSDVNIEGMLKRWGAAAGWRVIWTEVPEIKINGDRVVARNDFLSAADYVVSEIKAVGYSVKAVAHENKVLVISEGPK